MKHFVKNGGLQNIHGKIFFELHFKYYFYAPAASARRVVRTCVCAYVRPSEDQVKTFGQSRISRPINGSKLVFLTRISIYETSRNIQEPWPHDLYFMVHWLRILARLSRLRFLSKVESQDQLLMVASWYFIWGCIFMRPAGIYKSHELLTYISRSTDFGLARLSKLRFFIQGRISRPINGSKLIFHVRMYMYLYETNRYIQEPWHPDLYFTVCILQTLADFPWLIFCHR